MRFEWDENKNNSNIEKHKISFETAQKAFLDPGRIISKDLKHSCKSETRYFCFGLIDEMVITVRFTVRNNVIRIIGAGVWREGRKKYEKKNKI